MKNPRHALAGLLLAVAICGCQTTTKEKNNYNLTDAKSDSIVDTRIKMLEDEAVKYPLRADIHYEVAMLFAKKGDCGESAKALEKAISLSPLEAKFHFHLGRIYLTMGEYAQAEKRFREAVRLSGEGRYTGLHAALAWTLSLKNDIDGAIGEFKECVKTDPENPIYYYFLGSLHDKKQDREGAIHFFREYLARGGSAYRKKAADFLRSLGVAPADIPDVQGTNGNESLFGPGGPFKADGVESART
jgi:tetratricopeptide (TPR) repeat protein